MLEDSAISPLSLAVIGLAAISSLWLPHLTSPSLHSQGEQEPLDWGREGQPLYREREGEPLYREREGEPLYREREGEPLYTEREREPLYKELRERLEGEVYLAGQNEYKIRRQVLV